MKRQAAPPTPSWNQFNRCRTNVHLLLEAFHGCTYLYVEPWSTN